MPATIIGTGTAVPPHTMSMHEAVEMAISICCDNERDAKRLSLMYEKSGVKNRHTIVPYQTAFGWVEPRDDGPVIASATCSPSTAERMALYSEHAIRIAREASVEALRDAGIAASSITHLVTVSCTGFGAPGVDVKLMTNLALDPSVERAHIGFMGCHGAINGLRVAKAITESNPLARVLLCAVEVCSLHYCTQWEPEKMIANALFADGAAALIVTGDAEECGLTVVDTGSRLVPESVDAMSWQIGDHGFEMTLDIVVPRLIEQNIPDWLTSWLDERGQTVASIDGWCVHPGGPKILTAVENAMGLPPDETANSRAILSEFGNMSSPTVLFVLQRFLSQEAAGPFVLLGFGPGLIAEVALIT